MFSVFPLEPKLHSCTVEEEQLNMRKDSQRTRELASPHLQSGCVAAQVGRVDEAEAKDPNAATVSGLDVTQTTVLQV